MYCSWFSRACAPRAKNSRTAKAALPVRANLTIGAGYQIAAEGIAGKLVCSIAKQRPERYDAYLAAHAANGRAEARAFSAAAHMPAAGEHSEILNKERCRTPE
jgi:hypothetical protein